MRYIGGVLYCICDMCCIQNVGLRAVDQVYCIKRHNSSKPAHRELFNMEFFIITYIIPLFCIGLGGFQWGMYVIEDESQ